MAVATLREVAGPARIGRRTKRLVKELNPGAVAVLDHKDLDRVSAEDLIAAGVLAVLNCSPSSTGAYPNMGPLLLVQAGIHLVDLPDDSLFERISDGEAIIVRGGEVRRGSKVLAIGEVQEPEAVRAATDERRREIGDALEAFAQNTIEHMLEERELLSGRIELPRFDTDFRDRPALIVVRGVDHQQDLRALRPDNSSRSSSMCSIVFWANASSASPISRRRSSVAARTDSGSRTMPLASSFVPRRTSPPRTVSVSPSLRLVNSFASGRSTRCTPAWTSSRGPMFG